MELRIDFGQPVLRRELAEALRETDLNDFYATASDFDKSNLFFVLLTSLHHYEDAGDARLAAHLSFLAACYLYIALTPPGSQELALHYIRRAAALEPLPLYREWETLIRKGN